MNSQLTGTDWKPGARFGNFAVEIILLDHVNLITLTKFSAIPYKISVQHLAKLHNIVECMKEQGSNKCSSCMRDVRLT
jgi:hypothetical protein